MTFSQCLATVDTCFTVVAQIEHVCGEGGKENSVNSKKKHTLKNKTQKH